MQAFWMILSAFLFASMGMCIKYASHYFNNAELVFYRGVFGMAFMAAYARLHRTPLRTSRLSMHVWRSLIGVMSIFAWFYSIAHLPLATAMTLNYMSSIWIAAFLVGGALMLGKSEIPRQGTLVLTIMASFAGVVMLLRPAIDQNQAFAGLIGLMSGLSSAFAYMQIMAISRTGEPEIRTVFYFAVGTTVAGAVGMFFVGTTPWNWEHARWLPALAILASLGQLCMTKAYSMSQNHGGTLMVANLQYSGIVFSAMYGVILLGDNIPLMGWAGMAVIVTSAIAATVLRTRAAPSAPAEEH